jgi:NitT/TauT family transport system permease protein
MGRRNEITRWRRKLAVRLTQFVIVAVLLLAWEFSPAWLLDDFLWSRPSAIYSQTLAWLARGILVGNAAITLECVLQGLLFGGLAGILLGLFAGLRPAAAELINRPIEALFAVPKIALIPLFILWFGIGVYQHVIFTSVVVFFFFFFSVYNGVRSVPVALRNALSMTGASSAQAVHILYLPASLGWMIIALRLAMPYAFVAAVSTEVIASTSGLGNLVKNSASMMNSAGMFSAMFTLLFVSMISSGLVNVLARKNRWNLEQLEE